MPYFRLKVLLLSFAYALTLHEITVWGQPINSCIYDLGQVGPCDPVSALQMMYFRLDRGPSDCKKEVTVEETCRDCHYNENKEWSPCENGAMEKKEKVRLGSKDDCPAERILTMKCGDVDRPSTTASSVKTDDPSYDRLSFEIKWP